MSGKRREGVTPALPQELATPLEEALKVQHMVVGALNTTRKAEGVENTGLQYTEALLEPERSGTQGIV